jgi:predicted MPP superfamily phosphohydrolase
MELIRRWMPLLVLTSLSLAAQWYVVRRLAARGRAWAAGAGVGLLASVVFIVTATGIVTGRLRGYSTSPQAAWLEAALLGWLALSFALFLLIWRPENCTFNPGRRNALRNLRTAAALTPVAMAGYGAYIARSRMESREVDLPVAGLPKDLAGLRLVQLTDIHYGEFFGRRELERAVAMANEYRPHLALVTGDLISRWGDALAECMAHLAELRAEAGVLASMGNHERYAGVLETAVVLGRQVGIEYLREQAKALHFGGAVLNVAGVDYQPKGQDYLTGAEQLVVPGATNLLLSHNPDVFPTAAAKGFQATLAGHTHGGQVSVEILDRHQQEGSAIYVSRGLGTVGVPVRLGAPPEVSLIRLCAA